MGNWSLGSIHDNVLVLVENTPSNISGATLLGIADRQREYVENYVGTTIGSNSIDIKYQDSILKLTMADVLVSMQMLGADVSSFNLGDLSISKGRESNISSSINMLRELAMAQLNQNMSKFNSYKALGE